MTNRTKKAIDNHLHDLIVIESNLGTDSTPLERNLAQADKDLIIKKIRDLDERYYQDVFAIEK